MVKNEKEKITKRCVYEWKISRGGRDHGAVDLDDNELD